MDAPQYRLVINGQLFIVELPRLTPVQIRALAGIASGHSLLVESTGTLPDRMLTEEDVLNLDQGVVHVYVLPPTLMG